MDDIDRELEVLLTSEELKAAYRTARKERKEMQRQQFGAALRALRRRRGQSQWVFSCEIWKAMGRPEHQCSFSSFRNWEKGRSMPKAPMLVQIINLSDAQFLHDIGLDNVARLL